MDTYHFTDCVHCHKMKINVSLYRKLLFLKLINVAKDAKSFITCINNTPMRVVVIADCIYIYTL